MRSLPDTTAVELARVNSLRCRSTGPRSWLVPGVALTVVLASSAASAVPLDTRGFGGTGARAADSTVAVSDVSHGSGAQSVGSPSDAAQESSSGPSKGLAYLWKKPGADPDAVEGEARRARANFEFVRAAFSASDPNAATDVRAEDGPVGAVSLFVTEGLAFGATTVPGASRGLPALPGAKARRFVDADFMSNVSTMAVDFVHEWVADEGLTWDLKAVGQLQISLQAALLTPDGPRFAYVSDGRAAQSSGAGVEISTPMGMVARVVSGLVGLGMIAGLGFLVMRRR